MSDLLAAVARAGITAAEIEHEHDSIPVDGDIDLFAAALVGQGFACHAVQRGKNAFLSRKGDSQIEPTTPDVPKHQGWRVKTEVGFANLRTSFIFDTSFRQLKEHNVIPCVDNMMMAIMFQHITSEMCVQFVWRENNVFPPQ